MTTTRRTPPAPAPDKKALATARRALREAGITVRAWAEANGFDRQTVVDVLHGRRAGHYGEAHAVAVALGLKAATAVVSAKGFKPGAAAAPGRARAAA